MVLVRGQTVRLGVNRQRQNSRAGNIRLKERSLIATLRGQMRGQTQDANPEERQLACVFGEPDCGRRK